ncbi:hypothetical protein IWQ56_005280 [Coemansia nantahalensis]|uniref:Uncharacterized protein n=1 Tax=Coemansia nantahalensis TaxID=2789366 RepID=A0ACC1K678_9FUNG|nr:hypothetical protein IWQ56_005280 [Coemansia nantahalensis]KAJ2774451.1 hypothetical protein IWQ57_000817 [Coemansia nantahalensis]
MANPLEEWYRQLPTFTRVYTTAVVALALAVQLDWVTQFQLFHSTHYTFERGQYWRLATTFLFLGKFSLDWMLKVYFIVHYCRDLEEGSYLTRPADFAWTVMLMCVALLALSPYLRVPFLGDLLVMAMTYMWSRHYSHLVINFMGLFVTSAAYLPWVLLGFSSVVENRWPAEDVVAICVGHVFWFLGDEWPLHAESGGSRPLQAPRFLCRAFGQDHGDGDADDNTDADGVPAGNGGAATQDDSAAAGDRPQPDDDGRGAARPEDLITDGESLSSDSDDDTYSRGNSSAVRPGDRSSLHQRAAHGAPAEGQE